MHPFLIIGNPENRRVSQFTDALKTSGRPPPLILSHELLLNDPNRLRAIADQPLWVRLESVGENAAVERLLLNKGYPQARRQSVWHLSPLQLQKRPPSYGEILCPRQLHLGYEAYLRELQQIYAEKPQWKILNPPDKVLELFDKRLLMENYRKLGIPVPENLEMNGPVTTPDQLRQTMTELGWEKIFIKLSCASSASCLAMFHFNGIDAGALTTTMRKKDNAWYNSLKLQRHMQRDKIDEILNILLREGSRLEKAVPKARLQGAFMDCRILTVKGEPCFTVVRQNNHPITNLHLGGWRGDLQVFKQSVPKQTWEAVMQDCRTIAAHHGCFHVGIDVMFEPGFGAYRILESNAFGDLLPNLSNKGLSVYEWQIDQLRELP